MASGIYAQRVIRQRIPMRPQRATIAQGTVALVNPSFRLRSWLLYPIGAACVLMVVLSTGVLSQRPASSYVATGGQSYAIQVGGDQAGSWQHDQAATIPTPTQAPQATSTLQPQTAPYSVVGSPSLSVAFINQVLSAYSSPANGKGQTLYGLGVQYGIDPTFALAFFLHESTMGTRGEATKSLSLGNLRCIPNFRCEDGYAQFDTWEDGFKAWYQLIRNLYVAQWGLTTVETIIPRYAPQADNNNEQAYIDALKHAIDTWHAGHVVVS